MIRLFISKWDGRYDWLQTTAEHDIVWRMWAGDHGELSCAHLNGEWQFYAKSHQLISAFFGLSSWLIIRSSTAKCRTLYDTAWLPDNCTHLADSLQHTVNACKFPTLVGQFTQQPSCTILLFTDRFLIRITFSCEIFMILFNFLLIFMS